MSSTKLPPTTKPFGGNDLGALCSVDWPVPKSLWGVIAENSLNMIYAKPGSGKSFIATKIVHTICSGSPFLKWKGRGNMKAYHAEGEMDRGVLARRYTKIDAGAKEKLINPGDIHVFTYADRDEKVLPNIADPKMQERYEASFQDRRLILIDNLVTASDRIGNLDDDCKIWGSIQKWLVKLRDRGFTIILIHHAGKSGLQLGTSMREVIMDTVIELTEIPRIHDSDSLKFDMHFRKSRHFYGEDLESLRVEMHNGDDGAHVWDWYPTRQAKLKEIKNFYMPGMTARQLAEIANITILDAMKYIEEIKWGGGSRDTDDQF
jgi:hypothetical protein